MIYFNLMFIIERLPITCKSWMQTEKTYLINLKANLTSISNCFGSKIATKFNNRFAPKWIFSYSYFMNTKKYLFCSFFVLYFKLHAITVVGVYLFSFCNSEKNVINLLLKGIFKRYYLNIICYSAIRQGI